VTRDSLDELCVNTIRMLSVDAVQRANSGHPGLPMGAATMAYVLDATPASQPQEPCMAGPRPVRALGRPRQHAPLWLAVPDRVRPHD
jgi:hypothetical protein